MPILWENPLAQRAKMEYRMLKNAEKSEMRGKTCEILQGEKRSVSFVEDWLKHKTHIIAPI